VTPYCCRGRYDSLNMEIKKPFFVALSTLIGLLAIGTMSMRAVEACSQSVSRGERIYKAFCIGCHHSARNGSAGPNLTGILRRHRMSELEARQVIREGKDMMPAFAGRLTAKELDDLVSYLKTI
jgi:mono/diheme cytochrome c family protein